MHCGHRLHVRTKKRKVLRFQHVRFRSDVTEALARFRGDGDESGRYAAEKQGVDFEEPEERPHDRRADPRLLASRVHDDRPRSQLSERPPRQTFGDRKVERRQNDPEWKQPLIRRIAEKRIGNEEERTEGDEVNPAA